MGPALKAGTPDLDCRLDQCTACRGQSRMSGLSLLFSALFLQDSISQ